MLLVLDYCPARAAKWEIVPTVGVAETYTDNVALTPDISKQGDWVTQVIPGISIAAIGAGLRFNATYNPEFIYYGGRQIDNQVFQRGNANGTAELANKLLFFDFGARVDQYDASLQGPLTTNNVNATGNRTSVKTYFASPYIKRDIGSDVQTEARLTESVLNSNDPASLTNSPSLLSDSTAERIDLRLKSGPTYKVLTWDMSYSKEVTDYKIGSATSAEVVTANIKRLITPTVGVLAQAGYDNYQSADILSASEGPSWSTGFDWTPSANTRFAVSAGHRFYGDAYALDFSHHTRLTAWSAAYTQSVTTARSEFFVASTTGTAGYLDTLFTSQYPDPADREKAVGDFIAQTGLPPAMEAPTNIFSNQLLLVKRWQASAGILGVRNVLIANVFKENSSALVSNFIFPGTGDFGASDTVIQTGVSFLWNWRMAPQYAWNLSGAYSRNELPGLNRIDNLTYIGMGITRQFQPRLTGSLNYRRQQDNSSDSTVGYTENAVFAALTQRF